MSPMLSKTAQRHSTSVFSICPRGAQHMGVGVAPVPINGRQGSSLLTQGSEISSVTCPSPEQIHPRKRAMRRKRLPPMAEREKKMIAVGSE